MALNKKMNWYYNLPSSRRMTPVLWILTSHSLSELSLVSLVLTRMHSKLSVSLHLHVLLKSCLILRAWQIAFGIHFIDYIIAIIFLNTKGFWGFGFICGRGSERGGDERGVFVHQGFELLAQVRPRVGSLHQIASLECSDRKVSWQFHFL